MKYPTPPKEPAYQPEKPNHTRTVTKTLAVMLVYHGFSMLIYRMIFSASVNQLVRDEHWARAAWTMFGFALAGLLVIAAVFPLLYFKDSDRKRAYLTATSVEVRGAEHTAEGYARYRKLARKEGMLCTLATGILWLIPALFYTIFKATSGQGFGYGDAYGFETFFIGFVGLCEPFGNAWVGWFIGLAILFAVHYAGRLMTHKKWDEQRIRR